MHTRTRTHPQLLTDRRSGDSASPPPRYRPCGGALLSELLSMTPTRWVDGWIDGWMVWWGGLRVKSFRDMIDGCRLYAIML
jgi:hypothetical protein